MAEARRYNAFLADLIARHAPAGGAWLDFGAGSGQFAIPLKEAGHHIMALEIDPLLAAHIAAAGLPTFRSLDDVPDASLEYVYTLNVLEHVPDDEHALRLLNLKLRPGGRLLIYVPAFQRLYSSMDALVGHLRRYEEAELRARVERAGFVVEQAGYADSLGYVASLIYKWLPGRDGTLKPGSVAFYDRWLFPLSRALDRVTSRWLGKNVYVVARKA